MSDESDRDDRDAPTDEQLREREPERDRGGRRRDLDEADRDDRRESVERVAAAWNDTEGER